MSKYTAAYMEGDILFATVIFDQGPLETRTGKHWAPALPFSPCKDRVLNFYWLVERRAPKLYFQLFSLCHVASFSIRITDAFKPGAFFSFAS